MSTLTVQEGLCERRRSYFSGIRRKFWSLNPVGSGKEANSNSVFSQLHVQE